MQELLQLPLQVQAILVAGYWGYAIVKRDYRRSERLANMWLLILVFGLPTALVLQYWQSKWAYSSVSIAPVIALFWAKWGNKIWSNFLYRTDISHTIGEGDVWKTISSHKGIRATQINLIHKNGNHYLCEDCTIFKDDPFNPFIMDEDGIAFFVTHSKGVKDNKPLEEWYEIPHVKQPITLGSLLTYFPREDIAFLEIRFSSNNKTNSLCNKFRKLIRWLKTTYEGYNQA